jgi:hypothetical protein
MTRVLAWINLRLDRLNRRLEERNVEKARRLQGEVEAYQALERERRRLLAEAQRRIDGV